MHIDFKIFLNRLADVLHIESMTGGKWNKASACPPWAPELAEGVEEGTQGACLGD